MQNVLINNGKTGEDIVGNYFDRSESEKRKKSIILRTDKDGKPRIKLTPLEKTVVIVKNQREYNKLLQVYECGGWRWINNELPTYLNFWPISKAHPGIEAGLSCTNNKKGKFGHLSSEAYAASCFRIISSYNFYKKQKITPQMIRQINIYFKNAKRTN